MKTSGLLILLAIGGATWTDAQPVFDRIFPPDEFASRRNRLIAKIGDGVAILQGTTERPGEQPLRQSNQFFYLTGVVEPRAILVIDGRAHNSTLFLNRLNERHEKLMYGPGLSPGANAANATGLDEVLPRDEFQATVDRLAQQKRTIYTPFRPEVLGSASAHEPVLLANANSNDPWDGRQSREQAFINKLKAAAPRSQLQDLDPLLDALRSIKSKREIEVIREATRLTGLGIVEAMRDAKLGMFEYELQADAEFAFKKGGAYGPAYFALIATGANTFYTHYHRNTSKLKEGDLVQFDYAPDFKNYTSDVSRIFPANGRFSAWQREYYSVYLLLYRSVLNSIRVHATPADIIKVALPKMDNIVSSFHFTDPLIKQAAIRFVNRYRAGNIVSLGHTIGMEVHDVPRLTATFEPGQIFTIEPPLLIPEKHLGIRLEDVLLINESGCENLSAWIPIEIRDIEKMMSKRGLSDAIFKPR